LSNIEGLVKKRDELLQLNLVEQLVVFEQMASTLAKLNSWFVKKQLINKQDFMDLQLKCWLSIKKKYHLKFAEDKL